MAGSDLGFVVDLQDIFSAPIVALIDANVMAARAFVDFIQRYGFVDQPAEGDQILGELRMVSFSYEQSAGLDGPPVKRLFTVPALSLVPLPLLEVKDASFNFGVRILAAIRSSETQSVRLLQAPSSPEEAPRRTVRWSAMLAQGSTRRNQQTTEDLDPHTSANLRVRVLVGQADIPAGIKNLLAIMGENVQVSKAMLSVTPTVVNFSSGAMKRKFALAVLSQSRSGTTPPEIQIFYSAESGVEVRLPDGSLWSPGSIRPVDENGSLEASVVLLSNRLPQTPRVPIVFRTSVDQIEALAELVCDFSLLPSLKEPSA